MSTEEEGVDPGGSVLPLQEKCVVCNQHVPRDQLRSITSARGPEVRELIKECLGLDISSGFICRRKCFKKLQGIKSNLQKMTGNVIQSVAMDTEPQTSTTSILTSTPKVLPESQIKTAAGKRIVLVTVKKTETGIETIQHMTEPGEQAVPLLVMDPGTVAGVPGIEVLGEAEDPKSIADHSYIEGYSAIDDSQLLVEQTEPNLDEPPNVLNTGSNVESVVLNSQDFAQSAENPEEELDRDTETTDPKAGPSNINLSTGRPKRSAAAKRSSTLPASVAQALELSPAVRATLGTTSTPSVSYADTSIEEEPEAVNQDIQTEYKEAIKADRIKAALKNTLQNLLHGEIDFSTELRFQGTAYVRLDSVNVVKLKVNETAHRDEGLRAENSASPQKRNGQSQNRSKFVDDPSLVQEILSGSVKSDKATQTKSDKKRSGSGLFEEESPVKRPKTIISPEVVKSSSKLELPGKQQVSVTFIPNTEDSTVATTSAVTSAGAGAGIQNTVDVSQLQGVLSNFMSASNSAQLASTVVTSNALPNEIAEAVASLGAIGSAVDPQQQEEPEGNIMQAAVESLNLTAMDESGENETLAHEDFTQDDNTFEEETETGPTSAKSESVKVDGLLYDGMQFLLSYTQENSSRWNCAEKGCRASVNTTPLPNDYTIESLMTPTVLCATPHDVRCHQDGVNKVKDEDMRKVNGFVGIAEDDGKEVLAVYGYRFTRHSAAAGVGAESRWLCVQAGCFTTIFTDLEDNVNMFGWPYHSHPPQLYTEPTDAKLDGEPTVVLTLAQKTKPRRTGTAKRGRPPSALPGSTPGVPSGDKRRKHDYSESVIHVDGKKYSYNILQKDGMFECEVCHKQYTTFKSCRKHTSLTHYKPDEFQCKVCGKKGKDAKQMAQHEARHLAGKDRPLKCEICNRGYVKEFELRKHMELNHGTTQRRWECNKCGRYFLREYTYKQHLENPEACAQYVQEKAETGTPKVWNSRAKESTANFCTVCRLYYKDNRSLRLHLLKGMCSQHTQGGAKITVEQHGCHRCDAVFSDRPSLIRHLLFQCHKQDLVCDKCAQLFKTEDDHTRHIMTCVVRNTPLNPVISAKAYVCRKCGTAFNSQRTLGTHEVRCKARPVNISPIKTVGPEEIEKYNLTPCKVRVGKVSSVVGRRLPTGRVRRTPKKYADEAFEKGWVETRDPTAECALQTTKAKQPAMKIVRLSDGKVMKNVGVQQVKTESGMKFVVQESKRKGSKVEATTPSGDEGSVKTVSMVTDHQVAQDITSGNNSVQLVEAGDGAYTEETVTVTLDDPDMIAQLEAAAAAQQSQADNSTEVQHVVLNLQ